MDTAGPVTNACGAVVYFQIIWKGKSSRCYPRFNAKTKLFIHPCIRHDHAVKKTFFGHFTLTQGTAGFLCLLLHLVKAPPPPPRTHFTHSTHILTCILLQC